MKYSILPLLIFALNASGQIRYEAGYLIDHADTRITCFIRNVDWLNNPTEFNYKMSENGEVLSGSISTVKEFGVSGLKFINAQVKVDTSSRSIRRMSRLRHPEWKEQRVFLKVIVDGKADLFGYRNGDLETFFYSVDGSPIEQLVYKQYLVSPTDIATNSTYLQQLKNDVSCGGNSDARLKKLSYGIKSLQRYFLDFNICHGETPVLRSAERTLQWSLTPGMDFSSFKVDTDAGFEKAYEDGRSFRLGIMAEYELSFNKGKWSIMAEPTYQSYSSTDNVKYSSIEIPIGLRHRFFLASNTRLFANALVVTDIPVHYEVVWSQTLTYKANYPSISFAAGAGFTHKRFSIEGRKYFTRSVLDDANRFFFVYDKVSVILGYRLSKTIK